MSSIDEDNHPSVPDLSRAHALDAYLETARRRATLEEAPFWKEVTAFNQMPQIQIDQFYGQYVAVYGGNIVDSDFDEAELALRFYRTWGYVPVYIHKVGTEEGLVDAEEDQGMTQRVDVQPVPGSDVQISLLLAMLDDGTTEWREELGAVLDETVVWQPFPHSHSIGALILHITDVEAYWLHHVGAGQARSDEELARLLSQETQQYDLLWPRPPAQPLSWFLAQHDEIRARTRQIVSTWDDPAHVRPWKDAEFTRRWLLHHVLTHEAYHGGQAVLLSILHGRR